MLFCIVSLVKTIRNAYKQTQDGFLQVFQGIRFNCLLTMHFDKQDNTLPKLLQYRLVKNTSVDTLPSHWCMRSAVW